MNRRLEVHCRACGLYTTILHDQRDRAICISCVKKGIRLEHDVEEVADDLRRAKERIVALEKAARHLLEAFEDVLDLDVDPQEALEQLQDALEHE